MTIMAEAMNKRANKTLSSTNEDKEEQGVGDDDKKSPSTDVAGTGKRRVRREHSPIVKERAVKGVVTWFNFRKGYGFIHYDDDAEDIFVHHSAIARQTRQPLSLHDNQEVEFDIVQGIKGLEAACVSGPDGHRVGTIAMHPFASRSGPGVVNRRRRSEGDHVPMKNDDNNGHQEGKSGGPMKAISNIDAGEKKQVKTGNGNGKHKNRPFRRNRANHSSQKDSMDKAGEEPTQETNSQTDESDPKTAVEVEEKHEDESKN